MNTNHPATTPTKARTSLRSILESVLLQESRLADVTREYSWRVRGSPLQSVKRLFAEQGRQIDRWLSELMSCARAVGAAAVTARTPLTPPAEQELLTAPRDAVAELLARHEAVVRELRTAVAAVAERDPHGDAAMLLSGLLEFHETSAWMLRLLLDAPERSRVV